MVFLAVLLVGGGLGLDQGVWGESPQSRASGVEPDQRVRPEEPEFSVGAWFATSVWRHISEVDGKRCPSEPSCSSYSSQAFRKHGFFVGWVMTVDRLIHEADEGRQSPLVRRDGQFKILDPVEDNDFWWYGGDDNERN